MFTSPCEDKIEQLDGNISLISDNNMDISHGVKDGYPIPAFWGNRPEKSWAARLQATRKILRRDNRSIEALTLPKILNFNMRSLFSKIQNFSEDMLEREGDISFLTEVWQKEENKKHQQKIEEMFEMCGIRYISTPRPGTQRGGGAAIAVWTKKFTISKLNIAIPKSAEVVWGLLKPKVMTGNISTIIVCCFYSPPRLRKNSRLIDHLTVTLHSLLSIHSGAGVIISGDRNSIEIPALLSIDPTLRQVVKVPTRGLRTLDVIITNLSRYYHDPTVIPPIVPDNPEVGVPSDHLGIMATPNTSSTQVTRRTKITKNIRPLPESLFYSFEQKITTQLQKVTFSRDTSHLVQQFQDTLKTLVDETFPERKIQINSDDKPYFTEKLRKLKRIRQREYQKHGRSDKYLELKEKFEGQLKNEKLKFIKKISTEVAEGRRGSIYPALKKLGLRPGEEFQNTFSLPSHTSQNLSPGQSAELIASHFSCISQEFLPLKVSNLPPNIQEFLNSQDQDLVPILSTYDVHKRICKARKPNSLVPGDLHPKLVKVFANILAGPVTKIYNCISLTSVFPQQWKVEHQIPIPKVTPPTSEDELRNISKTPFFSKVYESFLAEWLLEVVEPFLDPGQCGLRGSSITHYLIQLLHFVFSTLDLRQPHAVLAAFIDLSKAFNRVDHTLLIQDLFDMHTPAWLLRIIFSYLSERSMFLTYKGAQSKKKQLPGGGPQGAFLGGIIFMLKFNGAFLRPPIPRQIKGPVNESKAKKVKYVDDGTVAVSINLKKCLISEGNSVRPLNYRERTEHILPEANNLLQFYLSDAENFLSQNKLKINKHKTQVMLFNKSRKWDFPPKVSFSDGTVLEVIHEIKLLGVVLSDDLSWSKNTQFICEKARLKLWILRRMINLNLDHDQLFDVYSKEIRSILEFGVPVWHPGLTLKCSGTIERIQKVAFKIILQEKFIDYKTACIYFNTTTLKERREKLCLTFATKNLKSKASFFEQREKKVNTRRDQDIVKLFRCRTNRYEKSSLPYMAKLLNIHQ